MRTLTARLVVITIALVAGASLLLGTATTFAMRDQLTDRLDQDVRAALDRAAHRRAGPPPGKSPDGPVGPLTGHPEGTLVARCGPSVSVGRRIGAGTDRALTQAELGDLCVDADAPVTREVGALGRFRLAASSTRDPDSSASIAVGLPTAAVDEAMRSLVLWELLLGLLATTVAGGLAVLVVRRQLRPLRRVAATAHSVAALPLASSVHVGVRVPAELTDERTEVGQVGASLNTLLAHVEASLAARERSEQQVRQFVADASHELRTPLATITGYAELARRHPSDVEGLQTAMAKVDSESARMKTLVEDLLLLARLDAGRPLASAPVDLTHLLLEAVSDARVVAPTHRWRLDLPDAAVAVTGDEHRLHQVVTNLLRNAATHTPAGTTVTVAARAGDPVVLTVHDDGPGIPPGLPVFERFTRGDASRSGGGAGLGLSLVAAIVAAHRGSVSAESGPGSTTFTVTLPG